MQRGCLSSLHTGEKRRKKGRPSRKVYNFRPGFLRRGVPKGNGVCYTIVLKIWVSAGGGGAVKRKKGIGLLLAALLGLLLSGCMFSSSPEAMYRLPNLPNESSELREQI